MAQSDLEDFTDAQDSQDWLSTLTKSTNKVRELQSLLIAESKQGQNQVAELQTALDSEKHRVKDLKKELYKTVKKVHVTSWKQISPALKTGVSNWEQ